MRIHRRRPVAAWTLRRASYWWEGGCTVCVRLDYTFRETRPIHQWQTTTPLIRVNLELVTACVYLHCSLNTSSLNSCMRLESQNRKSISFHILHFTLRWHEFSSSQGHAQYMGKYPGWHGIITNSPPADGRRCTDYEYPTLYTLPLRMHVLPFSVYQALHICGGFV